jgi:hypothetical protein
VRLQGESRRRRRGGGAGWIPAGGGAVAPEVGGVGPHPVHLLRLQLLHPFPRLLVLAPAPSLRASFRKGTGHGSNREDRCRTAAPTTGWLPEAASGGQRGVWQVGEGIGRSREVRPCLHYKVCLQIHYAEFLFPVISKCRHIYRVLNIDEIKN